MKEHNVLFFTRTMGLGGTENVVIQLCEILQPTVNKIVVCSSGGINVEKLQQMHIKHYNIPDITDKSLITVLRICSEIRKIIREEKITVIHSHHRMAALYAEILAPKTVVRVANAHNTFKNKKIMTHLAYRNTQVIAVGEMVKKNLTDFFGINDARITVIHNSVKAFDGKYHEIQKLKEARLQGKILVGNIGRLSEQKGMKYFIDAAAELHSKNPNIMFYIVGDGEDKEFLENKTHELNLDDCVEFLGYRPDVQNVMKQLDFVVLSSLWEGFPLTPIEAFSVEKTVIGTAVDGTVEIIDNMENGILIRPMNIEDIVKSVEYLITHPERRKAFEMAAYESYLNNFSMKIYSEKIILFYQNLR